MLFLAVMSALTLFLYGVGTAQDFLESTQIGLLRLSSLFGLLLTVGSAYGALLDVFFAFARRNRRFLLGSLAYVLSALFGAAAAVFSNGVLVVAAGNLA